ncbi:MAG: hypothetical protein L6R42_005506 [Xanthoria sp. 1 TBL-2021]|nr:MAG: hypothetical protein L6R42_005506 [Xanthoria sp. 1 TBL-2021]
MSPQPSTSIPTSGPIESSNPTTDQSPPFDPSSAAYDDDADPDINMTLDPSSSAIKQESPISGFDGTNDQPTQNGEGGEDAEGGIEAKLPMQKDISLQDFLGKMDDYAPIIPDAVTTHHLTLAGLPPPPTTPLPLARLLALATQKFIADIAADAYQYSRMRAGNSSTTTAPGIPGAGTGAGSGPIQQGGAEGGKGKVGQHVLGQQRAGYGGGGGGSTGRAVLTMEDLGCAVGEYGVNVKRGEFYR